MPERDAPLTEAFFYILLAVRRPNHGYGIIQEVQKLTNGRFTIGAGTLYGAVQTLLKRGWIETYSASIDARRKTEYILTNLGRTVFLNERARLAELLTHAELIDQTEEENKNA